MAFVITTPNMVGAQPIAETRTDQKHPLGTKVEAYDASLGYGEFVYLTGVASTVLGSVVFVNKADHVTSLAAAAGGRGDLATAMSINLASSYGWYQVYGKGVGKVLAAFADNADCYLTATAGSIDDADVSGDLIIGMKGASAIDTPSTGLAYIEMNYPSVAGVAD